MTSTVLDVTVMLLCVSASVVALGGVGGDPVGPTNGAPDADRTADRVTTETATVRYDAAAEDGERTVHATFAELLAMVAWDDGARRKRAGSESEKDPGGFAATVLGVVSDAFGDRTRIDVRVDRREADETPAATGSRRDHGLTAETTGGSTGVVEKPTEETQSDDAVAIGTAPPRGATVKTAVATTPVPNVNSAVNARIRFVVRTW